MIRLMTIMVATIGVMSVLGSYARYRWLAGPGPEYSCHWPLVCLHLVGPYLVVVVAGLQSRTALVGRAVFVGCCVLAAISLVEALIPVEPPFKDAEIPAAMILEGVAWVQYLAATILLLVSWNTIEVEAIASIPRFADMETLQSCETAVRRAIP